ncbi:MAG TPA: hypothetical protein VHQ20_02715 [Patescibacteria group bacterium]|jgi:hypothetical protein|nr:hypothetical protein [Patescibacteria group bacterium]
MELVTETTLDFDYSVSDEDRFIIRRILDKFATAANHGEVEVLNELISDSTVVEGFSDLPYVKEEFISVVSRWQGSGQSHVMRFPLLKLSYSHYLYHLSGTYEEFVDNILATEGTIELSMIKKEDEQGDAKYEFVKIVFFPRMRLSEE